MAGGRPGEDPIAFSLNAPVPGRVSRLAADLEPSLSPFESIRDRHSLVVKRLGRGEHGRLTKRARRALSGTAPIEARVAGVGVFEEPTAGSAPVVYLAVESPGLVDLHRRLCETFDPVAGIEADDYVPHVTLARGGGVEAQAAAERLAGASVEPVTWTVSELVFWDARHGEATGRVTLPA